MSSACILGLSGPRLTKAEKAFFGELDPWAFILFRRNVEDPDQVRALTADLRDCVGRHALVFIDQEGGRVQRMRPPHWRDAPPGGAFAALYKIDPERAVEACRLNHVMLAAELTAVGVDADCAPVLDIPASDADPIIGDRAFGLSPEPVIALGLAAIEGLEAGGCAAVIKHVPGHGRARVDSHHKLPVIEADLETLRSTDFAPFKALAPRASMAMTAHLVLESVDSAAPATTSGVVMDRIIRGEIGFDGLVMTDDLDMKALSGSLASRARASFAAGCDVVLQCSGKLGDMRKLAPEIPALAGRAMERAEAARAPMAVESLDMREALARLEGLMAPVEQTA